MKLVGPLVNFSLEASDEYRRNFIAEKKRFCSRKIGELYPSLKREKFLLNINEQISDLTLSFEHNVIFSK